MCNPFRVHKYFSVIALLLFAATASAQYEPMVEDSMRKEIFRLQGQESFNMAVEYLTAVIPNDPHENEAIVEKMLQWAKEHGDTLARLQAKMGLAQHLSNLGELSTALRLANDVYNNPEATPRLQFQVAHFLRGTYYKLGSYDRAIAIHSAMDWSAAPNNWEKYAHDNFLAFSYLKLGEYPKAIAIMKQCIRAMREHHFPYWELSFTNSLGVIYEEAGMLDSAWSSYGKALVLLENNFMRGADLDSLRYNFIEGLFNGNKAQILAKRGNHLQAIPLYKLDIEASLKEPTNEEYRRNGIISLVKLSDSYVATGQYKKARQCLKDANYWLSDSEFTELWIKYWKALWACFDEQKMHDSASVAIRMYIAASESLDMAATVKRSQDLQLAYESHEKEQALQERQLEVQNLKLVANEQRIYRNVILAAGIFLMVIVFVLYIAYRQRTRSEEMFAEKNRQIEEQSNTITHSLQEKELLLREIHHRVKNNLQIISSLLFLQSKKLRDKEAIEVVKEGQSRVHVMSLIHQRLYQSPQLDEINFKHYFSDLANQIIHSSTTSETRVQVSVETNNARLSVEKAVPVGLIINELITNSLKHAFTDRKKGLISISMRQEGQLIHFHYTDNGKGINGIESLEKSDSLGIKLIRLLTNQLDGTLNISSDNGMKVEIIFKN